MRKIYSIILGIFLLLISYSQAEATHLRAGQLIIERVNCQGLTFKITLVIYKDTGSTVLVGGGTMRLGDGSDPDNDENKGFIIPTEDMADREPIVRTDIGNQLAVVVYTYYHTYSAPGKYIISYYEQNRNEGILNLDNSVQTSFYIEAEINIDPFLGCNNSPVMLIPPVDEACTGVAFIHNPGAYDPDGDSLSFELVVPKKDVGTNVDNYRDPIKNEFYVDFPFSNEDGTGAPTFDINPTTGELYWDAPGDKENEFGREYNIAFKVTEWRKVNGEWFPLGYVIRDMQIIVKDCDNDRPDLIVPEDICVEAGTLIDEEILGIDPNGDVVKIEAFSQVFSLNSNSATYSPDNGPWQSPDTAHVNFQWQTDCYHVRDQPYQVVFKITDDPVDGPKLVNFATWNITVIAPKPVPTNAQVDFATKSVTLEWEDYSCLNASALQIWRRVDSYNYVPAECETGMPEYIGYELIDEVSPVSTSYTDNNNGRGLNVAASYCYILMAVFGQPAGGESIISVEICVDPIIADAPVLTHVTVDKTDMTNGEVTVSWKPPFEIDQSQFGTDYVYEVQRAFGLVEGTFATVGTTQDTTITDTGINTYDNAYHYRIVLYSNDAVAVTPTDPIDTSAVGSTVWLQPKTYEDKIELFWVAEVPWSNNSQNYPWHYIYRGVEGDPEQSLTLIDSANVNIAGFYYLDSGQWNNTPIDKDEVYCYYVITKGTYGNPKVEEPQLNKSQMICVQPSDDIEPCPPIITAEPINCDDFLKNSACGFTDYQNKVSWIPDIEGSCQDDVSYYELYFSNSTKGEFSFLATTVDTVYLDEDLSSFARCYKVRAVDRSGNRSDFSEVVCFDNCPYFELPNVFTPGNADNCNDFFSAYSDRVFSDESGDPLCGSIDASKCTRFVNSVHFRVYNRWGKQVYDYRSGGENTIYIDWDGKDKNGNDLSTGTYYYIAEVVFDMVNPDKRRKEYKGWVQILR